jgi:Sulfocyanin (SoxE) domain
MYMPTPFTLLPPRLLLVSLAAASAGCSKQSGSAPATETAASTAAAPASSDTVAQPVDTASTARADVGGVDSPTTPTQAKKSSAPRATTQAAMATPKPRTPAAKPTATAQTGSDSATDSASSRSASGQTAPTGTSDKWLSYDAKTNTVTFQLEAGPFTWNGFSSGGGTLTVPPKANIVMHFVNKDGTPHSAEVISGEGPIPNAAVDPAIPRAYTNKVSEGMPQEASDDMRFTMPETGSYRIFCGVPGHGLSGMWIWFKVDPAAKTPSFGATKK